MIELDQEIVVKKVYALMKEVGRFQLGNFRAQAVKIEEKSPRELVSFVDQESEKMLFEGLQKVVPEACFWGEETGKRSDKDLMWLVDPLDGTTNYLSELDQFSISLALIDKNKPVFGAVYKPSNREFYHAFKGRGLYRDLVKIAPYADDKELIESLIGTGFPYRSPDLKSQFFRCAEDMMMKCRGIRRLGSAALDLSYVAAGYLQGFWESELQPYDVGAALLFMDEMGIKVTNEKGEEFNMLTDRMIVAAKPRIHDELVKLIAVHYGDLSV